MSSICPDADRRNKANGVTGTEGKSAIPYGTNPDLWPLQVLKNTNRAAESSFELTNCAMTPCVICL